MGFATFLFRNPGHEQANYPFNFDASEKHTRYKTGIDFWPAHNNADNFQQLGTFMNGGFGVSGILTEQDPLVWAQGYGKDPAGPIVSALPTLADSNGFATSAALYWQVMVPGLSKQDAP